MSTLYTYYRSSAAYRVRIALNLKGMPYTAVPVHLVKDGGQHRSAAYRARNPQALVPAFELEDGTEVQQPFVIGTPDGQGADGSSALGVARPIIPIPTTKRRTYWYQVKDR